MSHSQSVAQSLQTAVHLRRVIKALSSSRLKVIFSATCGLEAILILYSNQKVEGIEKLYDECLSKKPKLKSFTEYLRYLESNEIVMITEGKSKKSCKTVELSPMARDLLDSIPALRK